MACLIRLAYSAVIIYSAMGLNQVQASTVQHCTNGITQWSQLASLNIRNIDMQSIHNRNRVTMRSTRPPIQTYIIRENQGRIYAETPAGRAYVQVCRTANNQLIATASVLGMLRSVRIETQGRNQGIIHVNDGTISFTAE